MNGARPRWDLFCRVVDHYGDVGIAWRLARQLVDEGLAVRLFVDDLVSFARIEPRIDAGRVHQSLDGIEVVRFDDDGIRIAMASGVGAVALELFGCGLPDRVLDAMEVSRPVWIEIEYLSAEAWVADFHGRPSPHPRRPLVRHYFYPGFGDDTGGLFVERDFDRRQAAFAHERAAFEGDLKLRERPARSRQALVFAYPSAPFEALVDAMDRDVGPSWRVLVPGHVCEHRARRGVDVHPIPFVPQADFDRELALCDAAFVRGEDSFVRAQLAGIPFVWHVYPQADAAHHAKLAAFLDRYLVGVATDAGDAHRALSLAWNGIDGEVGQAWPRWVAHLDALAAHARRWRAAILAAPPLVDRLLGFAASRRTALLN